MLILAGSETRPCQGSEVHVLDRFEVVDVRELLVQETRRRAAPEGRSGERLDDQAVSFLAETPRSPGARGPADADGPVPAVPKQTNDSFWLHGTLRPLRRPMLGIG